MSQGREEVVNKWGKGEEGVEMNVAITILYNTPQKHISMYL